MNLRIEAGKNKTEPQFAGYCVICDDELFVDMLPPAKSTCKHCAGRPISHPAPPLKLEARS